jgi:hypothetical protein
MLQSMFLKKFYSIHRIPQYISIYIYIYIYIYMLNENRVIFVKENYSRKCQLVVWGIHEMEEF